MAIAARARCDARPRTGDAMFWSDAGHTPWREKLDVQEAAAD